MNTFEVRSSQFPYDMSPWCTEKAERAAEALARLGTTLRAIPVSTEKRDDALSELQWAAYNVTKLLAFSCGADWKPEHASWIVSEGHAGYEKVAVSYGLLPETSAQRRARRLMVFTEATKELLDAPPVPGRTLLHEQLEGFRENSVALEALKQRLELVTSGALSWADFVPVARRFVADFETEVVAEASK